MHVFEGKKLLCAKKITALNKQGSSYLRFFTSAMCQRSAWNFLEPSQGWLLLEAPQPCRSLRGRVQKFCDLGSVVVSVLGRPQYTKGNKTLPMVWPSPLQPKPTTSKYNKSLRKASKNGPYMAELLQSS